MNKTHSYRGRFSQVPIYLGKCFRTFIYMDDWKVIPMAAVIGGLVALVAAQNLFDTMEGTTTGGFAVVCVCLWNGFFNSIQVICRERAIVKREHRSGMHITSYILAHMIYQAFICLLQAAVIISISVPAGVPFPEGGLVSQSFFIDFGITLFLITYAADMLALMISAAASDPTAAMTVMPFVLIFQLLFSGVMFPLSGKAAVIPKITISSWGMECIASLGKYNSLKMVALWNQLFHYRDFDFEGLQPVKELTDYIMDNDLVDEFCQGAAVYNQKETFVSTASHITQCWGVLILFSLIFAAIAVIILKNIDKDQR